MAKSKAKSFHAKAMRNFKREFRVLCCQEFYDVCNGIGNARQATLEELSGNPILAETSLTLQEEAFASKVINHKNEIDGEYEYATLFPGILLGWNRAPIAMEISDDVMDMLLYDEEDSDVSLHRLERIFPGCLLVDVRNLGWDAFDESYDAFFIYPSYDEERQATVLLFIAIGAEGWYSPKTSKFTLQGSMFSESWRFNETNRDQQCALEGIRLNGDHRRDYFSAWTDSPWLCDFASSILAFACSDYVHIDESTKDGVRFLHLSVAADGDSHPEEAESDEKNEEIPVTSEEVRSSAPSADGEEETSDHAAPQADDGSDKGAANQPYDAAQAEDEPANTAKGGTDNACEMPSNEAVSGAAENTETPVIESIEELAAAVESASDKDAVIADLRAEIEQLVQEQEEWATSTESEKAALSYHLKQAERQLRQLRQEKAALLARSSLADTLQLPSTPLEALHLAQRAFPDRLVFLEAAEKSAAGFTAGDTSEVWDILRTAATVLYPLIFDGATGDIAAAYEAQAGYKIALRDVKQINRNPDFAHMRKAHYKGQLRDMPIHIKGRSRKPGETLRVYLLADYEDKKLIIGHCGDHLTTIRTASL